MTDLRDARVPGGSVGKQVTLGGATTADGSPAGLVVTVSKPTSYIKYTDAPYEYYCQAAVASARSDAVWQVIRKTIATGDMLYAGTGLAAHAATDIATVAALTYTLGA
jgi:hypothetical protein